MCSCCLCHRVCVVFVSVFASFNQPPQFFLQAPPLHPSRLCLCLCVCVVVVIVIVFVIVFVSVSAIFQSTTSVFPSGTTPPSVPPQNSLRLTFKSFTCKNQQKITFTPVIIKALRPLLSSRPWDPCLTGALLSSRPWDNQHDVNNWCPLNQEANLDPFYHQDN